ncbi:hypothetical protein V5O48_008458 [Marasmius crinis-equi]|uniref:Secreted protein n=1 Tax=Marasmius crinis-equi TaxID=585013 RepID=A0ABR3FEE3_9AGAR
MQMRITLALVVFTLFMLVNGIPAPGTQQHGSMDDRSTINKRGFITVDGAEHGSVGYAFPRYDPLSDSYYRLQLSRKVEKRGHIAADTVARGGQD